MIEYVRLGNRVNQIKVLLDGKFIGKIHMSGDKWFYRSKGSKTRSELFDRLADLKKSLEAK